MELAWSLIDEYFQDNAGHLHHEEFEEVLREQVIALMDATLGGDQTAVVDETFMLYRFYAPCRTSVKCPVQPDIARQLERLSTQICSAQRTDAWYQARHNVITASAAFKIFGSPSKFNELVYEKCAPVQIVPPCFSGARHWGVKYEPVSVMVYEQEYAATIQEYGCLIHAAYPFLGASPDGINVAVDSPRYGRMLEIKNPFSRELTGIPKEEYWIQCQLQMEVCNIDACDLFETKFVEYASKQEFDADGGFAATADGKRKGVISMVKVDEVPKYHYAPLGITADEFSEWERAVEGEWLMTIYWKLDEVECTLIERNAKWFACALPQIKQAWDTILEERETGAYVQRMPKKKTEPII